MHSDERVSEQVSTGGRLAEWRGRRHLTQQAVAARLGVSIASVANWESGRARPSRMASALIEAMVGERAEETP